MPANITAPATVASHFMRDVAQHKLTIEADTATHRHLVFKNPDSCAYQFQLITWPGALCIQGDMGTYVFQRTTDMFTFFRAKPASPGSIPKIQPEYWGAKLDAVSNPEGYLEFDPALFKQEIIQDLVAWIRANRELCTKAERRDLWSAVVDTLLDGPQTSEPAAIYDLAAAQDFTYTLESGLVFQLEVYASRFNRPTYHYLWCCYAIAWGIQQYDSATLIAT